MQPYKPLYKRIPDTVYVFLVFFIFFVLNLTSNFSGPHDSMGYLNDLEKARDLFPAPHLLYHYTTFQLFHILIFFFPHVQHYYLVETVDAFWGCLGLTVVYRIFLYRMKMSRIESFFGTGIIAFSFGMWFYCSNIEVYMPPLFFLLFCLYVCTKETLEKKDVLLLAFLHSMAVLFHQANVLFTPIILWKFWDSRKNISFLPSFIKYGATSFVFVVAIYFVMGWWMDGHNNIKDFYTWLRGYTLASNYWFTFSFNTLIKALVGGIHALIGGHFIFRVKFLESFMNRLFFYHSLDDEAYLVRNLSYDMALFLLILTVLLGILMLILLTRIIAHAKTLYQYHRRKAIPLLMFLVIYSCFFFFWMPENLEFWIPQCGVLWIFLIGMNKQLGPLKLFKKNYILYISICAMLFIINYVGSIHWMKDITNDSVYVKIHKVAQMATEKDIIVLQDPWLLEDFLEQYTKSLIVKVPDEQQQIDDLDKKINQSLNNGGKIFLYTEGTSLMHSSKNHSYVDSLLRANPGKITDINNELTPVKVIER